MSNADVLKSLKKGDIVKVTRTVKIIEPAGASFGLGWPYGTDVGSEESQGGQFWLANSPTLKIEMVKKVAKQRTDYKVGDMVSGDELRATKWKRGTIVRLSHGVGHTDYILRGDGSWTFLYSLASLRMETPRFTFENFLAPQGFTIKYLPG